jgi:dipeptidyl aminopeptidase/acylaminoacyl peptidase
MARAGEQVRGTLCLHSRVHTCTMTIVKTVSNEDASYTSDRHAVPARLFRPADGGNKAPGVLLCPGRLREIEGLEFLARAMAEQGMVVLATQYRGMDMRPDDQDCLDGLDHLSRLPDVDSRRLSIVGHSRGAMAGLRVASRTDRLAAVVALQPVADLSAYVLATRSYAPSRYEALCRGMGETPEAVAEAYRPLSAIHYADRIRIPVLLLAGTQDLHAPVDESLRMRDALVAAGNHDVHLEVLDGVGHFFEKMYSGYQHADVIARVLGWLAPRLALAQV